MTLRSRWVQIDRSLPAGVKLLAVSKGYPASLIRSLAGFGQSDFGESRLQEAIPKLDTLADLKMLRWHFVGRLQANKVRGVVRLFDVIHSVDSFELAKRISRISGEEKRCPQIMLQIKLREDPSKGGLAPEKVLEIFPNLKALPNLKIVGLMTMTPIDHGLEDRRNIFKECRALADQLGLIDCSMGMSRDWPEAIEAGATWLRIGSKLFGARSKDVSLDTHITKNE